VLEVRPKAGDTTDIQAADRLIAVGQGVENQADLKVIQKIAQALKAEVKIFYSCILSFIFSNSIRLPRFFIYGVKFFFISTIAY
jgi:hypothetical protein